MNQFQPNNGKYLPWVLEQIKAISEATKSDKIKCDLNELSAYPDAPPSITRH